MRKAPVRLVAGWRFRAERPAAAVLGWIADPGSLTARLVARSHGRFRVRVTRLAWVLPTLSERHELGLAHGERALVREVVLEGRDEPWVVARSVIPRRTLVGRNRRLRWLGDRPLGAFLFRDPTLERRGVRVVSLEGKARENKAQLPSVSTCKAEPVWGRRSTFLLRGKPLLVAEYFLPALLESEP